jgi:hypothetical protein
MEIPEEQEITGMLMVHLNRVIPPKLPGPPEAKMS